MVMPYLHLRIATLLVCATASRWAPDAGNTPQTDVARVAGVALDNAKARRSGPYLLTPMSDGDTPVRHDSATIATLSRKFVRVVDPAGPRVVDTLIFGFSVPTKLPTGAYELRVFYTRSFRGNDNCIGYIGESFTYTVTCTFALCSPTLKSRTTGSGPCKEQGPS